MGKKAENKVVYSSPLSQPEAITIQTMENKNQIVMRMGYYSGDKEITFDVNKTLTHQMVNDLIENLQKAISEQENEK
ncbi:hypothetical protein B9T19_02805 [Ignatzschineria sp. F8392]|uniref:hypothetical protein n=1 Tax=Ignatzschineria sp. F8392 TaxID=1980117 RepID=UPI000B99A178|nr:hypothetical protein [Ignatzschineria sp. F8392]OYQ81612.1 hypothetical protein B9T19_02805 [Ignatzschineria sp. F8392]